MILFDRITKIYPGDDEPALDNVSLHIEPHEFVFLVGKSGAGKSTLIKMITKEEQPDSGKIIIGGIDLDYVKRRHIPHYRRKLGVVFQDYKLLPTRTVYENVAFALEIAGLSTREIQKTVPKVLDLVGLGDKGHKFPTRLSGGEQQRVSIARSVARQPKILIADEPTGNLDMLTRQEIFELLQKINDFGTTLLVTTHDENIVNNLGKRVITLKSGRIVADQKVHGIYRLDTEPVIEEPELQVVQRIIVPGGRMKESIFGGQAASETAKPTKKKSRLEDTEESLKIIHDEKPTTTKSRSSKKSVKEPTSELALEETPIEQPAEKRPAPRATRTAKMTKGSANEWYNASRPLRAAPKLSDFAVSQTVKLKPAPSTVKPPKKPVTKLKRKRVI